jgi:hypothetical protein
MPEQLSKTILGNLPRLDNSSDKVHCQLPYHYRAIGTNNRSVVLSTLLFNQQASGRLLKAVDYHSARTPAGVSAPPPTPSGAPASPPPTPPGAPASPPTPPGVSAPSPIPPGAGLTPSVSR